MDEFIFYPERVCSAKIKLSIDAGILKEAVFEGGCEGNLEGICRLVQGMPVVEVLKRLKGIDCGGKGTSCPDQLSNALEAYLRRNAK